MFIASQKKKENIAEYVLYMWQIEDIIRANNLNIESITANIIDKFTSLTDKQRQDLIEWYDSLIDMMRRENVVEKGHLQINKNTIMSLDELHTQIMRHDKFATYNAEFYRTLPYIVEIRSKAGDNKSGEIESCFNALYGILMLRLQGKEISKETANAINQISRFLAILSAYYKKDFNNELFTDNHLKKCLRPIKIFMSHTLILKTSI